LRGGQVLRTIYESRIGNLPRAILESDFVHVYDNGGWGITRKVLLQAENGEVIYLAEEIPDWLARTVGRQAPKTDMRPTDTN
jgi:predicted ABC-type ATPase